MPEHLITHDRLPTFDDGRMLLAFEGWMDGGDVSTGTVQLLIQAMNAKHIASIDPDHFFIHNFPGSMEVSALFRPHVRIEDGVIRAFDRPRCDCYAVADEQLLLFTGREPNIHWNDFAAALFALAERTGVREIYFVGSVAGAVPHTREPRLFTSVSEVSLKDDMQRFGLKFTNYEGPGSFITSMMTESPRHGVRMASLVAEIPAYVDGANPKSIAAVARRMASILGIDLNLDDLRESIDEWEKKLTEAIAERDDLREHIQKLEQAYDDDLFDNDMGDLKDFLEEKGVRFD